jgi:uncharacterized membrane protein YedE/YeeE
MNNPKPYANPYLVGLLLGATLVLSFAILGAGLGASGGIARIAASVERALAPEHTRESAYFGAWGENPMAYYLVFMLVGVFLGGLFSALLAGRVRPGTEKGRSYPRNKRLLLALAGGLLVGFAARLARGCTSGQALSGGAMLLTGSLLFLACMFAAGYAGAYFVRRQWHD